MGLFGIVPLDDEAIGKLKSALDDIDGVVVYDLDEVNAALMKRYNFVLFEGTPSQLSNMITEKTGETTRHIVFDMEPANIAGYAPTSFIQWISQNARK